jgi:hypothetical protein
MSYVWKDLFLCDSFLRRIFLFSFWALVPLHTVQQGPTSPCSSAFAAETCKRMSSNGLTEVHAGDINQQRRLTTWKALVSLPVRLRWNSRKCNKSRTTWLEKPWGFTECCVQAFFGKLDVGIWLVQGISRGSTAFISHHTSVDLSFPAALWLWGLLSLRRKLIPEYFSGSKARPVHKAHNLPSMSCLPRQHSGGYEEFYLMEHNAV